MRSSVGQLFSLDQGYAVRAISSLNGMSSKFGWLQASSTKVASL